MDRPVVALVRGRALGGGCGLASACDIVLAHPDAIFGYPEVHLGFVPALVMAPLRRKVGEAAAFELVARGRRIGAAEAVSLGLATRILPADDFGAAADEYLRELAGLPATAVALTKRLFHGLDGVSFEEAIARGAEVNAMARLTAECRDGVQALSRSEGGLNPWRGFPSVAVHGLLRRNKCFGHREGRGRATTATWPGRSASS